MATLVKGFSHLLNARLESSEGGHCPGYDVKSGDVTSNAHPTGTGEKERM